MKSSEIRGQPFSTYATLVRSGIDRLQERAQAGGAAVQLEVGLDARAGLAAEPLAHVGLIGEELERAGERLGVAGRDEHAGAPVDDRARDGADVAGDHRPPRRHRLEHHVRQPVAVALGVGDRRHDDDVRGRVLGRQVLVRARADELDAVAEVVLGDQRLDGAAVGALADDPQAERREHARGRADQEREALLRHEPADGEDGQHLGGGGRRPRGGAGAGWRRARSTPWGMSCTGAPARLRSPATSGLQAITHAASRARSARALRLTLRASTAWTLKPYGTPRRRAVFAATSVGTWAK